MNRNAQDCDFFYETGIKLSKSTVVVLSLRRDAWEGGGGEQAKMASQKS